MTLSRYLAVAVTAVASFCLGEAAGQEPVSVGRGSYASFTPLAQGRTDDHWGDLSTYMQSKPLWVTERSGQPIPTNDWWTGLINAPFADALWSYPAMVHPAASGVTVYYPSYWNDNGTEIKWHSSIEVTARDFTATSAVAHTWHDWDVEMLMADASGSRRMLTTLAHGIPFTWTELTGLRPRLVCSDAPELFDSEGQPLSARALASYGDDFIGVRIAGDCYGIYAPAGTRFALSGRTLSLDTPTDNGYVVIGLLPTEGFLGEYADYARNVPRSTTLSWSYDEKRGEISSTWTVEAVDLASGATGVPVIQGFLPHAYKSAVKAPTWSAETFLTPRGTMRMAAGSRFDFTHRFAGMLPWYAQPEVDPSAANPYRPEVMEELMHTYATRGTFGDDTYWGGKGLTQMALNMTFAYQTGNTELFVLSRDKLKAKLIDWLTYTPGEERVYFAYYPRWGGLVGQATSYDSDTFNDHHFHYGYYTLAGALLCMVDEDFKTHYGPMLRLVAKDYANWERDDSRFPFLRTLDPWVGHSYAGGLGDQGNSNGNGQESSSEAMQGWGGVYLLGVALGDKEMRDAGIFGWSTEARATREYWFDADHVVHRDGADGNYDYSLYHAPYNTNITCKGIGWWTWFSGDPLHAHGIQWMPISTALDYMSWDRDFVAWAYNDLMNTPGWGHRWFEDGTNPDGGPLGMLANDDWGNVALAYMQRAYPKEAAAIFDEAYERKLGIATAVSTGHISYYITHSHLTYGEIDLDINADIPSANAFVDDEGNYTYMVFNPDDERDVRFYRHGSLVATVRAPRGRLIAVREAPQPATVELVAEAGSRFPASSAITARVLDQYGATADAGTLTWSAAGAGSIDASGRFTWAQGAADGASAVVTAVTPSGIKGELTVIKGAVPVVTSAVIEPQLRFVEKGNPVDFTVKALDQYGDAVADAPAWKINGVAVDEPHLDATISGMYTVEARIGAVTATTSVFVTPALPDLAHGCPAVSSSEENVGTATANVNDGDMATRWGSAHADGEWVYVDLGKDCILTHVDLDWEDAYASHYLIQAAPDGAATQSYTGTYGGVSRTHAIVADSEWVTLADISGITSKGRHTHQVDGTGRYVRIKAIERGSVYGVSIIEMTVCGIPADATAASVIGIDIASEAGNTIDEDTTARFTAMAYHLDGSAQPASVTWSTDTGEITPDGLFTPASYGKAVITATTSSGLKATATVTVNEVVKLARIAASPEGLTLAAGETASFELQGLNQFGGLYDFGDNLTVSITGADGNPSAGITVDPTAGIVTAAETGNYIVRFACGKVSTVMAVRVVDFSQVNLALGRPATASSGTNPGLVTDGDASTRWQSLPSGEKWIQVELDGLYLVDRFTTLWEAALAKSYRVETSIDGDNWAVAATSTDSPVAGVRHTLTAAHPAPARYVRLMGTEMNEAGATYGMSIFEFEVYGTGRVDTDDTVAPVIHSATVTPDGTALRFMVNSTDASGSVIITAQATELAVIEPASVSVSANALSGTDAEVVVVGLNPASRYSCLVTATDACGNAASVTLDALTGTDDITGTNLALSKPVTASSQENDGLRGANAVDDNASTRWGSAFADGEWLSVDLEAAYRLQQISITVLDAAFASRYMIEYSLNGEQWHKLGEYTMTEIGTALIDAHGITARHLRYTGLQRATGYGISINELEVYGDRRMLSVAAVDGTDYKLEGEWDADIFAAIDTPEATAYDLTSVTGISGTVTVANPNCMLYVTAPVDATCNAVVVDGLTLKADAIHLYQGYDFNSAADIEVSDAITLHLAAPGKALAVMLPFDLGPLPGIKAYRFAELADDEARFYLAEHIPAHTPMVIKADTSVDCISISGSATLRACNPGASLHAAAAVSFVGTYRNGEASGHHLLDPAGITFEPAADGTALPSFSCALRSPDSGKRRFVVIDDPTGLSDITAGSDAVVDVYSIDGILLRRGVSARTATRGLLPGYYIVGGTTVRVLP